MSFKRKIIQPRLHNFEFFIINFIFSSLSLTYFLHPSFFLSISLPLFLSRLLPVCVSFYLSLLQSLSILLSHSLTQCQIFYPLINLKRKILVSTQFAKFIFEECFDEEFKVSRQK